MELYSALTSAPVREQVRLVGGYTFDECGYHLFSGLDATFVDSTAGFVDKYNGNLAPPPSLRRYRPISISMGSRGRGTNRRPADRDFRSRCIPI